VEEFRIGVAETYDVIVEPKEERAYTVFAESMDRSGYARGTLTAREGLTAPIPERRPRPLRTMADMGMGDMQHDMPGMEKPAAPALTKKAPTPAKPDTMPAMPGMKHPDR